MYNTLNCNFLAVEVPRKALCPITLVIILQSSVAHHCPLLRVEALKLAISHVMNTHNTALYNELHKKLVAALNDNQPASNLPDVAAGTGANANGLDRSASSIVGNAASVREWIEVRNKKAALKLEKLDTDLKNYKSNSIKVSLVSKF